MNLNLVENNAIVKYVQCISFDFDIRHKCVNLNARKRSDLKLIIGKHNECATFKIHEYVLISNL